jgi:hypothetical protein
MLTLREHVHTAKRKKPTHSTAATILRYQQVCEK